MEAYATRINLVYEGKNITDDITPYLKGMTYTDNAGGTTDDLSITLEDSGTRWLDDWAPTKGDKVQASIISDKVSLPCGKFEVDQIEYSAPPHELTIKCVSVAISRSMKNEKHSRAWENVMLSEIASDFASAGNLGLYFDCEDVYLERREQITQSDLEFLQSVCIDYGLSVKVNDGKLIIYDGIEYESHDAIAEYDINSCDLISYKFTSKTAGTYKKARLKYHHAKKNKTYDVTESDTNTEGTERTLELNEYADSESDARKIAKKRLKSANTREVMCSLSLKGNVKFLAGVNITLTGFGMFSGKYAITKATHSVTSTGYTTQLELKQGGESKKASKARKKKKQTRKKRGGAMLYYEGDNYYRSGE